MEEWPDIVKFRKSLKISQSDFAKSAGIPLKEFRIIEKGDFTVEGGHWAYCFVTQAMKDLEKIKKMKYVPGQYEKLCDIVMPRPIHGVVQNEIALAMVDRIMREKEEDLNEEQNDYLEALTMFIEKFEEIRYPM